MKIDKTNVFFYGLLSISAVIIVLRYYKASLAPIILNQSAFLSEEDGHVHFDAKVFFEKVVKKYPRISETPVHLVVFLNPELDCPACLNEFQEWATPLKTTSAYGLSLFMPETVSKDIVAAITEEHGLSGEEIIYYSKDDPISAFHNLGVFKVVLNQERGICWFEKGSRYEMEYHDFKTKIAKEIKYFDSSFN